MAAAKQVKVVFDGQFYRLLWHREILMMHTTAHLNASHPVRPRSVLDCRASGNGSSEGLDTDTIPAGP